MIDCETEIFDHVQRKVRSVYPGIYMTGEYVNAPSSFPCVSLEQKDNAVWRKSRDTTHGENHVTVMFELNVYSNKINGKKAECKAIAAVADEALKELGFTRMMLNPVPNLMDASVYRLTGRYRAIFGPDENEKIVSYYR